MPFDFPCPKCGRTILNVPESYAGQRGRCLNCKNLVTIPTLVVTELHAPAVSTTEVSATAVEKTFHTGGADKVSGGTLSKSAVPAALPSGEGEDSPEVIVQTDAPVVRAAKGRHYGKTERGLLPRRYPILRRYCGILTGLSLVVGGIITLIGAGLTVSPLFGFSLPALGTSSPLLIILAGLWLGMLGYSALVIGLTGVEFLRVVMDLEENTRKIAEREEATG